MADSEYKAKISIDADVSNTEKNLKELQHLFDSAQKGISRLEFKFAMLDPNDITAVDNYIKSLKNLQVTVGKLYDVFKGKSFGSNFDLSSFKIELDVIGNTLKELRNRTNDYKKASKDITPVEKSGAHKLTDGFKELQSLFNSAEKGLSRLGSKINLLDKNDYNNVMNYNKSLVNVLATLNKIYDVYKNKDLGSDFDISSYNSKFSELSNNLLDLGSKFKSIRMESSKLNFTRGLSYSPSKNLNTGSSLTNEQYKQQLEKALLDVDKNLTAEQRKRIELVQQESRKKQESILLAQREAQIAERLKNARLSGLETSIPKLKSDLDSISSRFNTMFSSGNFSGLNSASKDLIGIRDKITEIRNIVLQLQSQGVDVSRYNEQLSSIASQYSSLVSDVSKNIKSSITSSIKNVVNVANSFANTSIKKISEFAKVSIKTTGSYLSKLFSTLFTSLKNKFSGIFSSKNTGVSNITSQLKSLTMGYASAYGVIRLIKKSIYLSSKYNK